MHRLLPILLLCSSLLATAANADAPQIWVSCPVDANYTRGSAFQANLDVLLSSLTAASASPAGFATNTIGTAPDQAYGLAQCRADVINSSDCSACLNDSVRGLATSTCAGQKKAVLFSDNCLLRYSNESFFGAVDISPPFFMWNTVSATEPTEMELIPLMSNLTEMAPHTPRMFAAGSATVTTNKSIYGMAQCTRDLAAADCNSCLTRPLGYIHVCCDGKNGARIFYSSCSIRFEVFPFYNTQAAEAAMSPAPPPPPPPPGGGSVNGKNHTVRTALLVSISAAVALLLLLVFFLCKRSRKPHEQVQTASTDNGDEELRSSKFVLYDLSTLRAATDDFSIENKLGEGGFGAVYKVVKQFKPES